MENLHKSSDESYTLYSKDYEEHYHSVKEGALNESFIKHINPAFNHCLKNNLKKISILDICFGLGYNVFSSLYFLDNHTKSDITIKIISIELDDKLISSLIHFPYPDIFLPYKHILKSLVSTHKYKDERFDITIICDDVRNIIPNIPNKFDIVYQDAFSYTKNPALWTNEYFSDIKNIMNKNAILTTYSISTKIRLALFENDFLLNEHILNSKKIGTLAYLSSQKDTQMIDMKNKKQKSNIKTPLYDKDLN